MRTSLGVGQRLGCQTPGALLLAAGSGQGAGPRPGVPVQYEPWWEQDQHTCSAQPPAAGNGQSWIGVSGLWLGAKPPCLPLGQLPCSKATPDPLWGTGQGALGEGLGPGLGVQFCSLLQAVLWDLLQDSEGAPALEILVQVLPAPVGLVPSLPRILRSTGPACSLHSCGLGPCLWLC